MERSLKQRECARKPKGTIVHTKITGMLEEELVGVLGQSARMADE